MCPSQSPSSPCPCPPRRPVQQQGPVFAPLAVALHRQPEPVPATAVILVLVSSSSVPPSVHYLQMSTSDGVDHGRSSAADEGQHAVQSSTADVVSGGGGGDSPWDDAEERHVDGVDDCKNPSLAEQGVTPMTVAGSTVLKRSPRESNRSTLRSAIQQRLTVGLGKTSLLTAGASSAAAAAWQAAHQPTPATLERYEDLLPHEVKELWEFGASNNHNWRSLETGGTSTARSEDYMARGAIFVSVSEAQPPPDLNQSLRSSAAIESSSFSGTASAENLVPTEKRTSTPFSVVARRRDTPASWSSSSSSAINSALLRATSKISPALRGGVSSHQSSSQEGKMKKNSPNTSSTSNSSSLVSGSKTVFKSLNSEKNSVAAFGWVDAFVHESPLVLVEDLFDETCDKFLLGGARKKSQHTEAAQKGDAVGLIPSRRQVSGVDGRAASHQHDLATVVLFEPLVLAKKGERERWLVVYKRPHEDGRAVIELLFHMRLVVGSGNERVIFFLPADEEAIEKIDMTASSALSERRKALRTKNCTIVSGTEVGCVILTPDVIGLTRVRMVVNAQYDDVDLKDDVRLKLISRHNFAPIKGAQKKHERCDEVDALQRRYFINEVMPKMPATDVKERALIDVALAFNLDDSEWQRVRGSLKKHPTAQMFVRDASDQSTWGKAHGDIDDTLKEVFAWIWFGCSYERMQMHQAKYGKLLRVTDATENSSRSQVIAAEYKIAPNFSNRWGETRYTWDTMESGDVVVAFEPFAQGGAGLFTKGAIEGKSTGLYHFTKVAPKITTFTLVQKVDLGGAVPNWLMKTLVKTVFSLLLRVQERFRRRDKEVDREVREVLAARIKGTTNFDVPLDDKDMYESCSSLKREFEAANKRHLVKILMPLSPFVEYSMRPAETKKKGRQQGGRKVGTGKAVAEIDASADDAAAWIFDYCSRVRMKINFEKGNLPRVIIAPSRQNTSEY